MSSWEAVKHMNAILVISIVTWPIISNGHVTLQGSLSSIQVEEEAELLPEAHYYITSKTYNSTDRLDSKQKQQSKESVESSPNIIPPTTHRRYDNYANDSKEKNGSKVSYDFFIQNCDIKGTQLRCDSPSATAQESNLTERCFTILESSSFDFEAFPEDVYNRVCNVTEAVFQGSLSFACLGGPLILEGLLPNLEQLEVLKASDNALDILIQAKNKKRHLPSLKNLSLKENGFLNQSKLNQLFAPIDVSNTGKNGTNATLHLFPNLERLQLTGTNFTTFNLSPFYMIPHVAVNKCPELKSVTVEGVTSRNRIFSLKTLNLAGNPKLQTVSAWIIPSSPRLNLLDLTSNPQLRIYPTSFFSTSLLDHVNLTNSSFICDCNIKKHDPKFFRHLLDQNCTTQDDVNSQTLKTQTFLESSFCSTYEEGSFKDAKGSNSSTVSTFVNSDVIVDCPTNPINGSFLLPNGDDNKNNTDDLRSMPTHIAWITPMNDILVWIRQYVPPLPVIKENSTVESHENITITDQNNTAKEQYDAIKEFLNNQVIDQASQVSDFCYFFKDKNDFHN